MRTRPAFGRCDCAGSDRGWEVAGGYTSEASHVRRSPTPDGNSLLGGVAQLQQSARQQVARVRLRAVEQQTRLQGANNSTSVRASTQQSNC